MPRKPQGNFFKKNGRYLKGLRQITSLNIEDDKESVTTIFNSIHSLINDNSSVKSIAFIDKKRNGYKSRLLKLNIFINKVKNVTKNTYLLVKKHLFVAVLIIKKQTKTAYANFLDYSTYKYKIAKIYSIRFESYRKKYLSIQTMWVFSSILIFLVVAAMVVVFPAKVKPNTHDKYSIYSSRPLQLDFSEYEIYTRDSRSQKINSIYQKYNCPLEGLGEILVYEADKNDIPWWIVAAISFQESSCGKNTPKVDGFESYNAWGWAVYGNQVFTFNNWVRGVEKVSKYLSERFYSRGITDPCDIMKTYTPPSKGSWCEGVKHFSDMIVEYQTPEKN